MSADNPITVIQRWSDILQIAMFIGQQDSIIIMRTVMFDSNGDFSNENGVLEKDEARAIYFREKVWTLFTTDQIYEYGSRLRQEYPWLLEFEKEQIQHFHGAFSHFENNPSSLIDILQAYNTLIDCEAVKRNLVEYLRRAVSLMTRIFLDFESMSSQVSRLLRRFEKLQFIEDDTCFVEEYMNIDFLAIYEHCLRKFAYVKPGWLSEDPEYKEWQEIRGRIRQFIKLVSPCEVSKGVENLNSCILSLRTKAFAQSSAYRERKLQDDMEKLRNDKEKTQKHMKELQVGKEMLQNDKVKLQKEVEKLQADKKKWQDDKKKWQEDKEKLQKEKPKTQNNTAKTQKEIEKLQNEKEKLQIDKMKSQKELEKLQAEEKKWQDDKKKLQKDKEKLQNDEMKSQKEMGKLQAEEERWQDDKKKLQEDKEKLQSDKMKSQKEMEKLQAEKEKWQDDKKKLQEDKEKFQKDKEKLTKRLEIFDRVVTDMSYRHLLEMLPMVRNAATGTSIEPNPKSTPEWQAFWKEAWAAAERGKNGPLNDLYVQSNKRKRTLIEEEGGRLYGILSANMQDFEQEYNIDMAVRDRIPGLILSALKPQNFTSDGDVDWDKEVRRFV